MFMQKWPSALSPAFILFLVSTAAVGSAQEAVKVETQKPTGQAPGRVSISAESGGGEKEANPGVSFSKLGGEVARTRVPVPSGATTLIQASAPLGSSGSEFVLLNLYKRNNALFVDLLTAKGQQAGTRRNSVRLLAPFPASPENLNA